MGDGKGIHDEAILEKRSHSISSTEQILGEAGNILSFLISFCTI